MRGGSQGFLVRGANDASYVAKCAGNPQGNRTLINEWVITRLLKVLQLCTPEVYPLRIEAGLPGSDLLNFQVGRRTIPVRTGIHLGSVCPVDPTRVAIFDFLPKSLLPKVVNLSDLTRAFAVDKWVGQTDSRQVIFARERPHNRAMGFRTYLIDHGQSFAGSQWQFFDAPLHGLYYDQSIYAHASAEDECQRTVHRIHQLTDEDLYLAGQGIPEEWFETGDREQLNRLLESLSKRRENLAAFVNRSLRELRNGVNRSRPGLLLLLLLTFLPIQKCLNPTNRVADVEVSANRSADFAQAPVRRPLLFTANAYDIRERSLIAELVNEYGTRIWMGNAVRKDGRFQTNVPPIAGKGVFFFRLYIRVGRAPDELLREYVILVQ